MIHYQFALLRYRQSPTAGELVNIGVVMWVPSEHRILFSLRDHYRRLSAFLHGFEGVSYRQMVRHVASRIEQVSRSVSDHQTDMHRPKDSTITTILNQIVSDPDSCFQWSLIMAGTARDPETRLRQIEYEFILRHEEALEKVGRNERDIWRSVELQLKRHRLIAPGKVHEDIKIVGSHDYSWTFKTGWHNGIRQVLEPITFDYLKPQQLTEKATTWIGRLVSLAPADFEMTAVVAPPKKTENREAYVQAVGRLRATPKIREILEEEQVETFIPKIEADLEHR